MMSSTVLSQTSLKTNIDIFEDNISSQIEVILLSPVFERNYLFIFYINPESQGGKFGEASDETKFLSNVLKKVCKSNNINFSFIKDSISTEKKYNLVTIQIEDLKTLYPDFNKNRFLGEKTLKRKLIAKIKIQMKPWETAGFITEKINLDYEDEIPYDKYEKFEKSSYSFTKGDVPLVNVFERIIFPALLVVASAASILAFFLIRSK